MKTWDSSIHQTKQNERIEDTKLLYSIPCHLQQNKNRNWRHDTLHSILFYKTITSRIEAWSFETILFHLHNQTKLKTCSSNPFGYKNKTRIEAGGFYFIYITKLKTSALLFYSIPFNKNERREARSFPSIPFNFTKTKDGKPEASTLLFHFILQKKESKTRTSSIIFYPIPFNETKRKN